MFWIRCFEVDTFCLFPYIATTMRVSPLLNPPPNGEDLYISSVIWTKKQQTKTAFIYTQVLSSWITLDALLFLVFWTERKPKLYFYFWNLIKINVTKGYVVRIQKHTLVLHLTKQFWTWQRSPKRGFTKRSSQCTWSARCICHRARWNHRTGLSGFLYGRQTRCSHRSLIGWPNLGNPSWPNGC